VGTKDNTSDRKFLIDEIAENPIQDWMEVSYRIDAPPSTNSNRVKVHLPVEDFSFDRLTEILIETERKEGMSTLEMFRQYIREDKVHPQNIEEWFDLFFLYLGTREVKQYCRP